MYIQFIQDGVMGLQAILEIVPVAQVGVGPGGFAEGAESGEYSSVYLGLGGEFGPEGAFRPQDVFGLFGGKFREDLVFCGLNGEPQLGQDLLAGWGQFQDVVVRDQPGF